MRRLLWFTVGFTAITAAFVYLLPFKWLLVVLGAAGICGIPIVVLRNRISWWRVFLMCFAGACAATMWIFAYQSYYFDTAEAYHEKEIQTQIEVSDYTTPTKYGVSAEGYLTVEGKRYKARFYLNSDDSLAPGDVVKGTFELKTTLAQGSTNTSYYQGEGIFLIAYPKDTPEVIPCEDIPTKFLPAKIRRTILNTLDVLFPSDTVAFARALLLGDTSLLTYEEDTAYKISGIRHIVAVSGLHVSILFSLVYVLAGKHRVFTAVFGIPVLFLFAAVAGFTPSVMRACIMQSLMILAMLVNKEYDPPSALSFAVFIMLVANPLAVSSVSLQLSVGCMIGIFLFSSKIHNYLLSDKVLGNAKGKSLSARLKRWFAGSVSVSVGAMITTTPLCAFYFETISLVGIATNLLVLWAVSFIYYAIMAACVFNSFLMPLSQGIAWTASWLIRFVQFVAKGLSSIPFAAVYTSSMYIVAWLIFSYIMLIAFLLIKKKHPAVLCGCITVSLLLSITLSYLEPRTDDYRISVIDVGQGQSVLIQSDGENYLVDCGGDSGVYAANKAAQLLLSQGIHKLDGVILTHFDEDHVGGMEYLLSRIRTDAVYTTLSGSEQEEIINTLMTNDFSLQTVDENINLSLGKGLLTIYAPEQGRKDNESSLCVLFQSEKCDILITGDRSTAGENRLLENNKIPNVDILVVGHHGSDSSTGLNLLKATKPTYAVISVGADNRYGHPKEQVLYKLGLFGCKVLRTDIHGTIMFRG